ncbi:RNA polymerase sigma factor [Ilumatobacter sp.]|uniref:RNA polymerase sigma factor n=1 Tax=Ilumatobacter sp. TaxID=1967498 RepID=UPI003AF998F1
MSAEGDAAFEQYVLPEVEVMLRVARSLTRNRADAEDLVQDSLIRAYKAIERFDGRHPRAWLLTILRNTHINRNRRRRPELLRDPDTQLERLAQSPADDEAIRPDRFVDLEFDADLGEAFESLSEPFRDVIELVDMDGLAYAEAAEVLGIPVGTVMSRLHRGRKKIREQLRRTGVAPTHDDLEIGRQR